MFVRKIPAVLHLVLVHQHAKSHISSRHFNNLCLSAGSHHGLPNNRYRFVKWCASRCSSQAAVAHLSPIFPRLFSMHFLVQVVSFCQVKHVATQQSKRLAAMRELAVAEDIYLTDLRSVADSDDFVHEPCHVQRGGFL